MRRTEEEAAAGPTHEKNGDQMQLQTVGLQQTVLLMLQTRSSVQTGLLLPRLRQQKLQAREGGLSWELIVGVPLSKVNISVYY
jgi:hypothetical protein